MKLLLIQLSLYVAVLNVSYAIPALAFTIPDTGQTKCYNDTTEIPCPQPGEPFYGQDAHYDGPARSYTKLAANGIELSNTASPADGWIMTRDNVSGLIWEIKIDDGGIHDKDNSYSWSNAQSVFIAQLNNDGFGGFDNWRLPTVKELSTLMNSSIPSPGPTIDTIYFSNTVSSSYWSSTIYAGYTSFAWFVPFNSGVVDGSDKSDDKYVRAVRSGQ